MPPPPGSSTCIASSDICKNLSMALLMWPRVVVTRRVSPQSNTLILGMGRSLRELGKILKSWIIFKFSIWYKVFFLLSHKENRAKKKTQTKNSGLYRATLSFSMRFKFVPLRLRPSKNIPATLCTLLPCNSRSWNHLTTTGSTAGHAYL